MEDRLEVTSEGVHGKFVGMILQEKGSALKPSNLSPKPIRKWKLEIQPCCARPYDEVM